MKAEPVAFWALRDSFLEPVPEIRLAAVNLDRAADAVLNDDLDTAKSLIRASEMPDLHEYRSLIVEGVKNDVHRVREVPEGRSAVTSREKRMPSKTVALSIFRRDGWHCRFCGIPFISLDAIKRLDELFPDEVRWRRKPYKHRNIAINVMASSLDHILPHSRGGNNEPDNLVAACGNCQFGRMQFTLAEVGFRDPRERAPIVDEWDGLERLIK